MRQSLPAHAITLRYEHMPRDDFSQPTKEALAKRVALRCSKCRANTTGPHTSNVQVVNLGVACHICAASPGGPRFEAAMTPQQRSSIDNAIWLCQLCAKLIDSDPVKYTVGTLVTWKLDAEARAARELTGVDETDFYPQPVSASHIPVPRIYGLPYEEARARLIAAGWQPARHHWNYQTAEHGLESGNGLYFWEQGFHEIENASGTGLAHCTFLFRDLYGTSLVVITAGEVIPELDATAIVWSWHLRSKTDA